MKLSVLAGVLILGLICHAPAAPAMDKAPAKAPQEKTVAAKTERLNIVTADGKRHAFNVEIAADKETAMKGLMDRKSMPADHGMLFVFPGQYEAPRGFWMKNTYIPLDIIFIAKDGKVRNIGKGVPESLETVESDGPVMHVLELNGGTAEMLGIKAGDKVHHGVFGNALEP